MKPHDYSTDPIYLQALARYAAGERSDPFVYARGLTHLRNGIASYRQDRPNPGSPAFYNANGTPSTVVRIDGTEFVTLVYERGRVRP